MAAVERAIAAESPQEGFPPFEVIVLAIAGPR